MSKKVQHIVIVYLDWEWAKKDFDCPGWWVEDRMRFFHDFTLQSMLEQTFQDFRICVFCGLKYAELTKRYKWHPRVERIYDKGKALLESLDSDYLAMTRIDSDDLFHKDALLDVDKNLILSDKMECLIFRKNLVWDRVSRFIGRHIRQAPPFFTHIYPKKLYKDWAYYERTHLVGHGKAGGRDTKTRELSENKVCVIKHLGNVTMVRVNRKPEPLSIEEAQRRLGDKFVTGDKVEMAKILKGFGVNQRYV